MELGLYTFIERTPDPVSGGLISPDQRLRDAVEEAVLADEVGLDVLGVGEHHRADYVSSSPAVALAAMAARTSRIRLTSAVSVLSSDDPVRVFQQFAMLDGLSAGRAEIMAGRGSFIESFPLFGYDLADYDALFDEKLRLLLELRQHERVTWSGQHRAPLEDVEVHPRPVQEPLPVWLAVGGNPPSVVRAASLGLPMALAIIGGQPARFAPLAQLFRDTAERSGHPGLPLSLNAHGFIGATSQEAADLSFPSTALQMNRIGAERGWPPMRRADFEAQRALHGALVTGSPEEVAGKILWQHEIFGHERFLLQLTVGSLPHREVLRAIERYGSEVAPIVRSELAR
ncbi:MAG: Atu2307/SP_0267 family LLM class monooxygenase [Actinomycetota bacterium]